MSHKVSVIIPFYNHWELTHQRLMELYKYIPEKLEIVLVNDCSTDADCTSGIAWWQESSPSHEIKYVKNKENLGFGGSHNRGYKASTGDILVFLSNDVIIKENFIQRIKEIINENNNVIIGGRLIYWDSGWNTITVNGKKSIITYPEGWLISSTREVWDKIGGFDSRYGKFDAEDIDIGAWALYNDVELISLESQGLAHLSGRTINDLYSNRMDYTKKNIKILKDKWEILLEEKING